MLDDELKAIWLDHAEGRLSDSAAQALAEEAAGRRRGRRRGNDTADGPKAASDRRRAGGTASKRREKVFGPGRGRPLDRNVRARIVHLAHAMRRERIITRADVDVIRSLLFDFHNHTDGRCFPSYQTIAKAAACAVSTVGEAIKRLEEAGLLTWANRLARIRERCAGLLGPLSAWRWRVIRTSNAYRFDDPASKTDFRRRTATPDSKPLFARVERPCGAPSAHAVGGIPFGRAGGGGAKGHSMG